ncbi:MAG: DUF2231 domain-containing protein [Bacteroidota bacterium]
MELHPAIVHFPIALLITAGGFYTWAFFKHDNSIGMAAFILHIIGLAGMGLAVLSGEQAEGELIHTKAIHELVEQHELYSFILLWLFGMLLAWYFLRSRTWVNLEKMGYLAVFWVLVVVMGYSAYLGGQLVYTHGAGVAPMKPIHKEIFQQEQQALPDNPSKADDD